MSDFGWGAYLGTAALWAAANLWLYRQRTQPGRELGLSGSLSVWSWDFYVAVGIALGAFYRPFGVRLTAGWLIAGLVVGLVVALVGAALALWGMLEFRSLARVSALEENRLVTSGIYAHVRHPQHSGMVAVFGLAVAFQTVIGLLLAAVVLAWSLVQTRLEDRRLVVLFGDEARRYIAAVPRYVPRRAAYRKRRDEAILACRPTYGRNSWWSGHKGGAHGWWWNARLGAHAKVRLPPASGGRRLTRGLT